MILVYRTFSVTAFHSAPNNVLNTVRCAHSDGAKRRRLARRWAQSASRKTVDAIWQCTALARKNRTVGC